MRKSPFHVDNALPDLPERMFQDAPPEYYPAPSHSIPMLGDPAPDVPPTPYDGIPQTGGVDWSLVASCDPSILSESGDLETLQAVLASFVNAKFTATEAQLMPNPLTAKLFSILQIGLTYMNKTQNKMAEIISQAEHENRLVKKKLKSALAKLKSLEAKTPSVPGKDHEKCPICSRIFKSMQYLDNHIQRRHVDLFPAWRSIRTGKLQGVDDLRDKVEDLRSAIQRTRAEIAKNEQNTNVFEIQETAGPLDDLRKLKEYQDYLISQTKMQNEAQKRFRREIRDQLDNLLVSNRANLKKAGLDLMAENPLNQANLQGNLVIQQEPPTSPPKRPKRPAMVQFKIPEPVKTVEKPRLKIPEHSAKFDPPSALYEVAPKPETLPDYSSPTEATSTGTSLKLHTKPITSYSGTQTIDNLIDSRIEKIAKEDMDAAKDFIARTQVKAPENNVEMEMTKDKIALEVTKKIESVKEARIGADPGPDFTKTVMDAEEDEEYARMKKNILQKINSHKEGDDFVLMYDDRPPTIMQETAPPVTIPDVVRETKPKKQAKVSDSDMEEVSRFSTSFLSSEPSIGYQQAPLLYIKDIPPDMPTPPLSPIHSSGIEGVSGDEDNQVFDWAGDLSLDSDDTQPLPRAQTRGESESYIPQMESEASSFDSTREMSLVSPTKGETLTKTKVLQLVNSETDTFDVTYNLAHTERGDTYMLSVSDASSEKT